MRVHSLTSLTTETLLDGHIEGNTYFITGNTHNVDRQQDIKHVPGRGSFTAATYMPGA